VYLQFFGLTEAPFGPTADPRWVFETASHTAARDELVRGIVERRGLLCLLGDVGTGKSLLLRQLQETPPERVHPVTLLHPGFEFDEIVEYLVVKLGLLGGVPTEHRLDEVRAAVTAEVQAGGNVVLLIDEAQALGRETLATLAKLVARAEPGGPLIMQIVLAGQPALEETLEASGIAGRITVRARLEPLSAGEVERYIRSRVARAGVTDVELFDGPAMERIAALSEGVPRLVNALGDGSLLAAFTAGARVVAVEHVEAAWTNHKRFGPTTPSGAWAALQERGVAPSPSWPRPRTVLGPPTGTTVPHATTRPWRLALPVAAAVLVALGVNRLVSQPRGTRRIAPAPVSMPEPPPREAATAPAPGMALPPTAAQALQVIDEFRRAYEARDAGRLGRFLAADAREDGRRGSLDIVAAHARVLERLAEVTYLQPDARLQPRGSVMEVRAPFVIRYRDRQGRPGETRGTAVWQVALRDGEPRIVALRQVVEGGSPLLRGG
jgi:type II secretory pathway predicted ATPase ExeA